jgi:membrane associated rhomboid family serine protease
MSTFHAMSRRKPAVTGSDCGPIAVSDERVREQRVADHPPVRREPIFNAPTIVLVVIAVLVIIHTVREFVLDYDGQIEALVYLAFIPARLTEMVAPLPGGLTIGLTSSVTHALLHGDWLHLTINGAWFLAFGSLIARRTSVFGFLMLFAASAVTGALFFAAINPTGMVPLVGASGAISGLMGAAFRLIFSAPSSAGFATLHSHPLAVPRMPLSLALRDQRTMTAVLIWIFVNLAFGFGLGDMMQSGEIAWEAHIGGFLFGFLGFTWFDRGPGYAPWSASPAP